MTKQQPIAVRVVTWLGLFCIPVCVLVASHVPIYLALVGGLVSMGLVYVIQRLVDRRRESAPRP